MNPALSGWPPVRPCGAIWGPRSARRRSGRVVAAFKGDWKAFKRVKYTPSPMPMDGLASSAKGDAMTTRTMSVWYKRAKHDVARTPLQSMLDSALVTLDDPTRRLWAPGGARGSKYGINSFSRHGKAWVGQFVAFEPGYKQPVIKTNSETGVAYFDIAAIAAGEPGSEFLEGICYFMVFQDHVVVVPSKGLGTKQLEPYLLWLLATATDTIPKTTVLALSDQPTTATLTRVAKRRIRGVTFGTPVRGVSSAATVGGENVLIYEAKGGALDALRDILGENIFDKVRLTQALDNANVEVQVKIRVKGKQTVDDDAQKLLAAVATAARHFDPDDVSLEVQGIGTLKGHDLKITKSISVNVVESGGLVYEADLWAKMLDWFTQLLKNGAVEA